MGFFGRITLGRKKTPAEAAIQKLEDNTQRVIVFYHIWRDKAIYLDTDNLALRGATRRLYRKGRVKDPSTFLHQYDEIIKKNISLVENQHYFCDDIAPKLPGASFDNCYLIPDISEEEFAKKEEYLINQSNQSTPR